MRIGQNRPFFKITLILAVFLIALVIIMNLLLPKSSANGYTDFILAFEFAKSPAETNSLFSGLSTSEIRKVDLANYFDFGFMLCYSALLAFVFYKSIKLFNKKRLWIGVFLSFLIFIADFFENMLLLRISKYYITSDSSILLNNLINQLHFITWIKWGGLAVIFTFLIEIIRQQKWKYKILGLFWLAPLIYLLVSGEKIPSEATLFTQLIFIAFFVLAVFGLWFEKDEMTTKKIPG